MLDEGAWEKSGGTQSHLMRVEQNGERWRRITLAIIALVRMEGLGARYANWITLRVVEGEHPTRP